jgi:hypothetical protein
MHVKTDRVVIITGVISMYSIIENLPTFLGLLGSLVNDHQEPSNSEVLAQIEQGFKQIETRLALFQARLEGLLAELRLVIHLALYHPLRTEIHLLLNELHETLKHPSAQSVSRFILKVCLNE